MTFRLRGLDPAGQYEVTDLDAATPAKASGKELMEKGLAVVIKGQPWRSGDRLQAGEVGGGDCRAGSAGRLAAIVANLSRRGRKAEELSRVCSELPAIETRPRVHGAPCHRSSGPRPQ